MFTTIKFLIFAICEQYSTLLEIITTQKMVDAPGY